MKYSIIISFLVIFIVNEVHGNSYRNKRNLDSMGEWIESQASDLANWSSKKYNSLKGKLETFEDDVLKIKGELQDLYNELQATDVYKKIEELEHKLLGDEAGVEHIKERSFNNHDNDSEMTEEERKLRLSIPREWKEEEIPLEAYGKPN